MITLDIRRLARSGSKVVAEAVKLSWETACFESSNTCRRTQRLPNALTPHRREDYARPATVPAVSGAWAAYWREDKPTFHRRPPEAWVFIIELHGFVDQFPVIVGHLATSAFSGIGNGKHTVPIGAVLPREHSEDLRNNPLLGTLDYVE